MRAVGTAEMRAGMRGMLEEVEVGAELVVETVEALVGALETEAGALEEAGRALEGAAEEEEAEEKMLS